MEQQTRSSGSPALGTHKHWIARLACAGVVLALCVIMLGAWTRLRDAGLGCPDWPTCYGSITVPLSDAAIQRAHELYPDQPFVATKAWPEMIHRHFAKAIGLLTMAIAIIAFLGRRRDSSLPRKHAYALFGLVCLQGAFGAWTVTMKLFPPVVTGHLLLGFTTLTTLVLLACRSLESFPATALHTTATGSRCLLPFTVLCAVVVALQIALGGWTASNYAAAVCVELPICQSGWPQLLDFSNALKLFPYTGSSFEYAPHLDGAAKLTIHVLHRIGAIVSSALLVSLVFLLLRHAGTLRRYRRFALLITTLLLAQLSLGVINILFQLPLYNAVAHNITGALLLQSLVLLAYALYRENDHKKDREHNDPATARIITSEASHV